MPDNRPGGSGSRLSAPGLLAFILVSRTRTERLVNLVICLLSTRRFLTAAQIAATVPGYEHDPEDPRDHEAFQRKFERDKAELRDLGVPLETGTASVFDSEPGYRIAHREYALPAILLEPDEAAAVGIAARLWQHAGLAAAASSGLAKLRAAGVEVDPQATLGVEPVVTVDPAFGPLTTAARDRRAVTFAYRVPEVDDPTTRRLEPWGVVCWQGRWYVVGHDRDRGATRCFRLSRIVGNVRLTGGSGAFTPPENVDLISHVARWFGPVPRTGRAAMMLATAVPCESQSKSPGRSPTRWKSSPRSTTPRPRSCGWSRSTPESTTATVTPAPVLNGRTAAAPSTTCAHG